MQEEERRQMRADRENRRVWKRETLSQNEIFGLRSVLRFAVYPGLPVREDLFGLDRIQGGTSGHIQPKYRSVFLCCVGTKSSFCQGWSSLQLECHHESNIITYASASIDQCWNLKYNPSLLQLITYISAGVPTKLIAEIWECCNISKKKFRRSNFVS